MSRVTPQDVVVRFSYGHCAHENTITPEVLKALPENEPLDDSYPCPICQAAEEIADLIRITTTEQFDTALGIARLVVADEVRS